MVVIAKEINENVTTLYRAQSPTILPCMSMYHALTHAISTAAEIEEGLPFFVDASI